MLFSHPRTGAFGAAAALLVISHAAFAEVPILAIGDSPPVASPRSFAAGDTLRVGDHEARSTRFDALPYVDSEFTRRYKFDSYTNPKLKELRERYRLDSVVATGRDEFDRQVLFAGLGPSPVHEVRTPLRRGQGRAGNPARIE